MNIQMKKFKLFTAFVLFTFSVLGNAETVTYYINDIAGSPVAAMDQSGSLLWRESYNPFGEGRIDPSQNENDIGFTGHQKDESTGLTYMQARYYDPVIGRFYSDDPVSPLGHLNGLQGIQGFNRYSYANNNPYKYTDPNGENIAVAACGAGPNPVCIGGLVALGAAIYVGMKGTNDALEKRKRDRKFGNKVKDKNREKNDGDLVCDGCRKPELQEGKKRKKGVPVPADEAQADHIDPLADGGEDDAESNGQILCFPCHKEKTREENKERAKKRKKERDSND